MFEVSLVLNNVQIQMNVLTAKWEAPLFCNKPFLSCAFAPLVRSLDCHVRSIWQQAVPELAWVMVVVEECCTDFVATL